jgi:hypothetical protein
MTAAIVSGLGPIDAWARKCEAAILLTGTCATELTAPVLLALPDVIVVENSRIRFGAVGVSAVSLVVPPQAASRVKPARRAGRKYFPRAIIFPKEINGPIVEEFGCEFKIVSFCAKQY